MDDEFKLCWKNFQDNIASGFQNLYDRGDLVDVTLACDGKLLQAHKIVLAICSPYFQEIFTTNPCQHPIIILKDVSFNIMCELLEFMYQGVVNVKHTELQSFMKIGQLLQIKGLATNSNPSPGSNASEKSTSQTPNAVDDTNQQGNISNNSNNNTNNNHNNNNNNNNNNSNNNNNNTSSSSSSIASNKTETDHNEPLGASSKASTQSNSRTSNASPSTHTHTHSHSHSYSGTKVAPDHHQPYTLSKRHAAEYSNDSLSIYSRKQLRRSLEHAGGGAGESGESAPDTSMEGLNADEFFMPTVPHISMTESRYDLGGMKRESEHHGGAGSPATSSSSAAAAAAAVASLRNPFGPAFNLEYNFYKTNNSAGSSSSSIGGQGSGNSGNNSSIPNTGTEYPNDLYMPNDYSKNFGNHMDIPPIAPGEHWFQGKLEFMLSQRGKPLLVHDGHTFGIQYVRKDKKYWQCNLSRKFNCKARVTTTDTGEIIVTNNEHCHTEIRQHLRKDYQRQKVMMNALMNISANQRLADLRRQNLVGLAGLQSMPGALSLTSPIDEVVQNLHNLAKASAEANEHQQQQQQQQQQQEHQQRAQAVALNHDNDDDEPLDCGLRSSMALEEMARSFMANKVSHDNNDTTNNSLAKENDWKCKNEGSDVH